MAAVDHTTRPQPHRRGAFLEHFEKALESPYPYHRGKAKYLLKDYATMKGYIHSTLGQ